MPTNSSAANFHLDNFDPAGFLDDYWQQQPLLLPNAMPSWQNLVSADELAGLALEDIVESRLLEQKSSLPVAGTPSLALQHGPFTIDRLQRLGERPWTLLVQAVDHYREDVALLLEYFNFIPRWQIDDIMVSCASTGGGVGPHFDRYDVFLLQGQGKREWKLGQRCDDNSELIANSQLNQLQRFDTSETLVLEPGDILYIPPYIAHWGTALEDNCITYSIGFRSPGYAEMLDAMGQYIASQQGMDERLRVPVSLDESQPGRIEETTIRKITSLAQSVFTDEQAIRSWFGQWITRGKYAGGIDNDVANSITGDDDTAGNAFDYDHETLHQQLLEQAIAIRNPAIRFAYTQDHSLHLFIDGESLALDAGDRQLAIAVKNLCNNQRFETAELLQWLESQRSREILIHCFNRGFLYFECD